MEKQKMSGFGIKDYLPKASLVWKCFGTYNKDRQFHTFNNKYVRDFIKGGKVAVFNRYSESKKCKVTLITSEKHIKRNDNEF